MDDEPQSGTTLFGYRASRTLASRTGVVRTLVSDGERPLVLEAARDDARTILSDELDAREHLPPGPEEQRHLCEIVDLAESEDELVVVREHIGVGIHTWLAERGTIALGEWVTLVAPIAELLERLHESGIVGLELSARAIELDADGTPVALGWGIQRATRRATPAWRAEHQGALDDAARLRTFACDVLAHVDDPTADELAVAIEAQAPGPSELAAIAFAAAPALPLRRTVQRDEVSPVVRPRSERRPRQRDEGPVGRALRAADEVLRRLRAISRDGAALALRVGAGVRSVRRPVWIAAGFGVAAGMLAIVLGVLGGSGANAQPVEMSVPPLGADSAVSEDTPETSESEPSDPTTGASAAPSPGEATAPPGEGAITIAQEVTGVQLEVATTVLGALLARETCLDGPAEALADCLGPLLHADSGSGVSDGAWRVPPDALINEVQLIGDAAVIQVQSETSPASVLAMSTEAGWVLRDVWVVEP